MISALKDVTAPEVFGGKAAQLGTAIRAGLAVPPGFAVSSSGVEAIVNGEQAALEQLAVLCAAGTAYAVRSSATDEDGTDASFAGAYLSVLGVCGADAVADAIRHVWASARDHGASAYRERLALTPTSPMSVVVQELIDADVAGVLFTRNPVTGATERLVEASWGLGEVIVGGHVIPDQYRFDTAGQLLERTVGEKDMMIRRRVDGGTEHVNVPTELIDAPCLREVDLTALNALAMACDQAFGTVDHDIEFAFRDGTPLLLQRRAITRG